MSGLAFEQSTGGFVFDNCRRNELLLNNGVLPGKIHKTVQPLLQLHIKMVLLLLLIVDVQQEI